jgi:hypothetical protein
MEIKKRFLILLFDISYHSKNDLINNLIFKYLDLKS